MGIIFSICENLYIILARLINHQPFVMNSKLPLRLAGALILLSFPFVSFCCDQFTSFTAKPVTGNCGAIFSFTYVECNSSGIYYIEYSPDDVNYYIIGTVTPNGSGSYSYTDNYAHPPSGSATVEYRAVYYIAGVETVYSGVASVALPSTTCSNNNVSRCNGLPASTISGPNAVCDESTGSYTISSNLPWPVTWSATGANASSVSLSSASITATSVTVTNNSASGNGVFTLVANEEGCYTQTDNIFLGIAPFPTEILPTPQTLTSVEPNTVYDFTSPNGNWWTATNGTVVSGQNTTDVEIQVANITSGTLTVTAAAKDVCGTSDKLVYQYTIKRTGGGGGGTSFVSDSTGGLNTGFGSGVKLGVYPNPVTNSVQVAIAAVDYTQSYIKLYDLNGRLLKMIIPTGQTTLVDMSKQAQGIYIMEIFDGKQRTIQKVVRL
jgi:hypothetical protein